jgi:ESCRT-II complex subunit VPS36|eukprot:CAMPEP_0198695674 /NCGR_PEP_ID=MMETSP1468-20131203/291994_1 /TAXON_ID=1461545 /ORGANISM="Mantoniella sp, Strain CCMP1436" /LENGTH=69 /DNA_ID=CAMNT_0044451521 /DNA_START=223 /DNA_END=432 /DNA_ORIENTATION=-
MLLLEGVALTSSGRPVLAPEELELKILEKTDLEFTGAKGGGGDVGGLEGRVGDKYILHLTSYTLHLTSL